MALTFIRGRVERAGLARLAPGADLIESIEEVCRQMKFKCAAVTSCIGSLRRADIMIAVPLENKVGAGYGDPMTLEGPLELLCAQGTVGEDEADYRMDVEIEGNKTQGVWTKSIGPRALEPGEEWDAELEYRNPANQTQKAELTLYRSDQAVYREKTVGDYPTLHLWVDVK